MKSACPIIYCRLWPVLLYHIFPQYLIKGTIFGQTLLKVKYVLGIFCTNFYKIFLILRKIQRDAIINIHRYVCQTLIKLESSRHIFVKYLNIGFYGIPRSGSRVVPCGRTDGVVDRCDEAIDSLHSFANVPTMDMENTCLR
jgi:hypothetical protein